MTCDKATPYFLQALRCPQGVPAFLKPYSIRALLVVALIDQKVGLDFS